MTFTKLAFRGRVYISNDFGHLTRRNCRIKDGDRCTRLHCVCDFWSVGHTSPIHLRVPRRTCALRRLNLFYAGTIEISEYDQPRVMLHLHGSNVLGKVRIGIWVRVGIELALFHFQEPVLPV